MTEKLQDENTKDINQQFWECILEDIKKEFPENGDPLEWDQPKIRYFLRKMSIQIKERFDNNHDLARSYELNPEIEKRLFEWGTVNVDTFRNIFLKGGYNTKSKTRDKFAVLFGYLSGEDYKNKKVLNKRIDTNTIEVSSAEESKLGLKNTESNENPSNDSAKAKKKNKYILLYAAVISLFLLSAFFFTNFFQGKESSTRDTTIFEHESSLKILIFPLTKLAYVEGQNYNFPLAIQSRIENNINESEQISIPKLEVIILDTSDVYLSNSEIQQIGAKKGADLIIWGEYGEYKAQEKVDLNLQYSFVDTSYWKIAELSGWESMTTEGDGVFKKIKYGELTGEIEQVINSSLALLNSIQDNFAECLYYLDQANYTEEELTIEQLRIKSYAFYRLRQIQDGLDVLSIAYALDSNSLWILNNMGEFNRILGNYNEADSYINRALFIDPNFYRSIFVSGNIHASRGEIDKAIDLYNRANELSPNDLDILYNRGAMNMRQGNLEIALEDFERYKLINPEDPDIYGLIGSIHQKTEVYQEAINYYKQAISLDSLNLYSYSNLAYTYYLNGDQIEAYNTMKTVVTIDSSQTWILSTLGVYCKRVEKYAEAIKYIDMALELDSNYWKAISNLGDVHYELGAYEKAIGDYNKALDIESSDLVSIFGRGKSYLAIGSIEKAEADLEYCLNQDPNDAEILHFIGKLYLRKGLNIKAIESLLTAVNSDSLNKEIYTDLSLAYKNEGKFEEAQKADLKAKSIDQETN